MELVPSGSFLFFSTTFYLLPCYKKKRQEKGGRDVHGLRTLVCFACGNFFYQYVKKTDTKDLACLFGYLFILSLESIGYGLNSLRLSSGMYFDKVAKDAAKRIKPLITDRKR